MRFRLLAATALCTSLLAFVPGTSFAQDGAAFDWSGFYFGGTVGGAQKNSTGVVTYPEGITPAGYSFSGNSLYYNGTLAESNLPTLFGLKENGGAVGLHAGYNLTSGSFVYGVEADLKLLLNSSPAVTGTSTDGNATVAVDFRTDALATVRGRVGVSVDRLLLFATAGLATGHNPSSSLAYSENGKSAALAGSAGGLPIGYVVGGGLEYAITDNIALKAEAMYFDLGTSTVAANNNGSTATGGTPTDAVPYSVAVRRDGAVISTGLSFRF